MWIIFALGASVMWGLTYVVNEQVYKKVSFVTSLGITTFVASIVFLAVAYVSGALKKDALLISTSNKLMWLVLTGVATFTVAEIFIAYSISAKNATLAGLIEISYPIFIALFAYILFRENQISLGTFIGGLLIFSGVTVIYYFNR